jgi:hypothetical protein
MGAVGAVIVLVVIGGIALAGWMFSEGTRVRRALRKAPRIAIGAMQEGQVARVVGKVSHGEPIAAPISGRPCFYFDAIVEERYRNGWRRVLREKGGVPFGIEDGTGRAMVDPTHADVALTFDASTRSGTFDDATGPEEAFLARHKQKSQGWVFNRTLRYREAIIEPNEVVAIMGQGVREPDPEAAGADRGYRDAPPTLLRMRGGQQSPLLVSDDPDLRG